MKKVSFIGLCDYGNTMTYWAHALNEYSSKFEARSICVHPHRFQYKYEHHINLCPDVPDSNGNLNTNPEQIILAKEWILQSDFIVYAEEMNLVPEPLRYSLMTLLQRLIGFHLLELFSSKQDLKKYIWHSGIDYRSSSQGFNVVNPRVFDKVLMGVDLFRLSPKTKEILVPFVVTDPSQELKSIEEVQAKYASDHLKIFHAPSSHGTKGTEDIRKVIHQVFQELQSEELELNWTYEEIVPPVPNEEVLKKKRESHLYIDQYQLDIGGYGISSTEALAQGNIVFSSLNKVPQDALQRQCLAKAEYEQFPIIDTGENLGIFKQKLKQWMKKPKEELLKKAVSSYQFHQKHMTFEASARRFEETVFND